MTIAGTGRFRRAARVGEGFYVLAVVFLAAVAMADPNHPRQPLLLLAMVLCLPTIAIGLPVLYVAGSVAWNLTGADSGGIGWPVGATYATALGLTAAVNIVVLAAMRQRRRERRVRDVARRP